MHGKWQIVKLEKNGKEIHSQHGADKSEFNPCIEARDPCNKNLKNCVRDKVRYPYFQIDVRKDKFNQIGHCEDRGMIDGKQCRKVICSENAGFDDDFVQKNQNMAIPAIIDCVDGMKAHPIYFHPEADRWCLSKYDKKPISEGGGDENAQTLEDMLEKQVKVKSHIKDLLLHVYDKRVQSFWFRGDANDALRDTDIIPSDVYNSYQQKGLINWELTFDKLSKADQEVFKQLRKCDFASQNPDVTPNCASMTLTPWDLLQIAVDTSILKSADTQTLDIPTNSETKPEDKVINDLEKAEKKNAKIDAKRDESGQKMKPEDAIEKKEKEAKDAEEEQNSSNNPFKQSLITIIAILFPTIFIMSWFIRIF